jgi:hypothetical protein
MKKSFVILIAFIIVMMAFAFSPESLLGNSLFEEALRKPIIEGKEAAGIKIGDSETKIINIMGGLPLHVEDYGEPEKIFSYGHMSDEGGVSLNIFTKNGSVIGIEIISRPILSKGHLYRGKTLKGFAFGNSIARVKTAYGEPHRIFTKRIFWYREEGIIFEYLGWDNEITDKITPNAVVIIAPNSDIIPHLRKRGGYE